MDVLRILGEDLLGEDLGGCWQDSLQPVQWAAPLLYSSLPRCLQPRLRASPRSPTQALAWCALYSTDPSTWLASMDTPWGAGRESRRQGIEGGSDGSVGLKNSAAHRCPDSPAARPAAAGCPLCPALPSRSRLERQVGALQAVGDGVGRLQPAALRVVEPARLPAVQLAHPGGFVPEVRAGGGALGLGGRLGAQVADVPWNECKGGAGAGG